MVAILDADKEGFLRSERSLIQTAGRTARHLNGKVILYAERVTGSMQRMMDETTRRRTKQLQYNLEHHIIPESVYKTVDEVLAATTVADVKAARDARREKGKMPLVAEQVIRFLTPDQKNDLLQELRKEMENAAKDLDFERAASLRDEIARVDGIALPAQKHRR